MQGEEKDIFEYFESITETVSVDLNETVLSCEQTLLTPSPPVTLAEKANKVQDFPFVANKIHAEEVNEVEADGPRQLSIFEETSSNGRLGLRYPIDESEKLLRLEEEAMVCSSASPVVVGNHRIPSYETLHRTRHGFTQPRLQTKATLQSSAMSVKKVDMEMIYLIALTMIDKVGPKTSRTLLHHFGGAEAIFRTSRSQLMKIPSVGEKIAKAIHGTSILSAAEREVEFASKHGINIVTWYESGFPRKLKEIDDSPLVLYTKGGLPTSDRPHVAIVGTRRPSSHGKKIAAEFASYFAERGVVVVSGLAYGIDYESHAATVSAQGATIAVLGHGLDQVYPRDHATKAREIVDKGGALVSEFSSGTPPDAYNFPARNRIISGLCDAILVVEATEKGGALITAKCAFEQDREVFAIPGALGVPTSIGCNRLIRDNIAKIACEPSDVLDSLQHLLRFQAEANNSKKVKPIPQMSDREHLVYRAIEGKLLDFDTIAVLSGILGSELQSVLLGMEFRQIVARCPGNKFQLA
ncbi:MAG: DNA-protecting protein DprA [Bacteroidetes bacterium]|nr:DNA-protecting protein DprA [Bacteroidota bacterium]